MDRIMTPLGVMVAGATKEAVVLLEFVDRPMLSTQLKRIQKRLSCVFVQQSNDMLGQLSRELTSYFEGKLKQFTKPSGQWPGLTVLPSLYPAIGSSDRMDP